MVNRYYEVFFATPKLTSREKGKQMTNDSEKPQAEKPGRLHGVAAFFGYRTEKYAAWEAGGKQVPANMASPEGTPQNPAAHVDVKNIQGMLSFLATLMKNLDALKSATDEYIKDNSDNNKTTLFEKVSAVLEAQKDVNVALKVLEIDLETTEK